MMVLLISSHRIADLIEVRLVELLLQGRAPIGVLKSGNKSFLVGLWMKVSGVRRSRSLDQST